MNKYYVTLSNKEVEEVYADSASIEYGGVLIFYNANYMKDTVVAAYAAGEWRTFCQDVHEDTECDG